MSKQEVFSLKSTKVTANNLENIKRAMRISIYELLKYINVFERTFFINSCIHNKLWFEAHQAEAQLFHQPAFLSCCLNLCFSVYGGLEIANIASKLSTNKKLYKKLFPGQIEQKRKQKTGNGTPQNNCNNRRGRGLWKTLFSEVLPTVF